MTFYIKFQCQEIVVTYLNHYKGLSRKNANSFIADKVEIYY